MSARWLGYAAEVRAGHLCLYLWFNPDYWQVQRWRTWNGAHVMSLGPIEVRWPGSLS